MRTHEQLAVVDVRHGHTTDHPGHHHRQDQASPAVMTLGKLAWQQGLALLWGTCPYLLGFDAKKHRIATCGQEPPHHQGVHEAGGKRQSWQGHGSVR